ncbi:probable salivary secreted peptide [Copidosoma floridanum]|uniref:probable salivary secreted peptide n=1 Tax=Copidosoma floridanum TaxID=29053 RepID=UPI0006C93ECE|nr:probable salivary secreted peptide [Copidosoma floridanum]
MATSKTFVFLATYTILLLAATVSSNIFNTNSKEADTSNHLIVGHRESLDTLAHQENVSEWASLIGRIVEKTRTFNITNDYVITQIRALDRATDGTGANAVLVAGGPGSNFATLEFESQRFHGIYFTVQLYAKYAAYGRR